MFLREEWCQSRLSRIPVENSDCWTRAAPTLGIGYRVVNETLYPLFHLLLFLLLG